MNWFKVYFSPFKFIVPTFYIGETVVGTPYFYPRRWVRDKEKPGYSKAVPKLMGFDFVGLGWKTKWSESDFRFEWSPVWSFVFFGYQIAIRFIPEEQSDYWELWLSYEYLTDKSKSKKERLAYVRNKVSGKSTVHYKDGRTENIDYWDRVLKDKYKK